LTKAERDYFKRHQALVLVCQGWAFARQVSICTEKETYRSRLFKTVQMKSDIFH